MKDYAKSFYESKQWKDCRLSFLQSKYFICERCGGVANTVHHKKHITPQNIGDYSITLSWDNLEALCPECHNKEHKRSCQPVCANGLMFDSNGQLVEVENG